MNPDRIRQQFLDFFASKGHTIVPSSPVVPLDDPTLMFANAGMNQFKDVFLGVGARPYTRAANTQKCIRAGGKHNDLDDVGQDTYHHTFFEMLGNWSFGDYFKKEAITWAWELLTEVWGFEKDRLHATYFGGLKSEPQASACADSPSTRESAIPDAPRGLKPAAQDQWELEPDLEARDLWLSVTDIDPSNVHPGSAKDNFWEMGDTGPCGPCSEIHVDLTPDKSGRSLVNAGDPRVIELWNLVFIQFNRDAKGTLSPLPAKHVDTGMGFERLCAMLEGMKRGDISGVSNYDTEVFRPIFKAIRKRTGAPAYQGTLPIDRPEPQASACADCPTAEPQASACADSPTAEPQASACADSPTSGEPPTPEPPRGLKPAARDASCDQVMVDVSYRVIADHLRCLTFALTDGAIPSNEGRGYVLRRILRRAVRYGRQYMDMHEPFLCDLVAPLVDRMGGAFPELRTAHGKKNVAHVTGLIRDEEASFLKTLDRGIRLFNEAADQARKRRHGKISGEDAFRLHDTFGFPIDLTQQMAEEGELSVELEEYERLMEEARQRAQKGSQVTTDEMLDSISFDHIDESYRSRMVETDDFPKYRCPATCEATILYLSSPSPLDVGDDVAIVTDPTCFYTEQGGQISDTGTLRTKSGEVQIDFVRRIERGIIVHKGRLSRGTVDRNQPCSLIVDNSRRVPTMQNHTATHLLNWALREVLCPPEERENPHVQQKGSLVDPDKTRFDFSHNKPLSEEHLSQVESLVMQRIDAGLIVYAASREKDFVDQSEARRINTLRAVFGEKYPDKVRVVSIGAPITEEDARQAQKDGAAETDWLLRDPKDPQWMHYSVEFCGGTHVANTKEIEAFVLTHEEGVAKGIRRVVGISGDAAREAMRLGEALLDEAERLASDEGKEDRHEGTKARRHEEKGSRDRGIEGSRVQTEPQASACADSPTAESSISSGTPRGLKPVAQVDFAAAVSELQQRVSNAVIPLLVRRELTARLAELQKKVKELAKASASESGEAVMVRVRELLAGAETVGGVKIVVGEVPDAPTDKLRGAIDWVRNKTGASAVLLASVSDGRVTLIAGMSKDAVARGLKAGDLIREIAPLVGGKGGGRPDMAQGGGTDPSGVSAAIERAGWWIAAKLG